ncbi:MAG: hypothetical protein ACI9Y7_002252 [Dokdonia sp.]|jgi:hypothetical protein
MYSLGKKNYVSILKDQPLEVIPRYEIEEFEITVSSSNTFQELRDEINPDYNICLGNICFGDFFYIHTMKYDSLVFDKKTCILKTIRLKHSIKEKKPKNKKIAYQAKTIKGNLKLEKWSKGHKLQKSFKYRYYNKKTNTILSYGKKFLKSTSIITKLEIADDVFLLFNEEKQLCAWLLKNPEKFLVQYYFYRKDLDSHIHFKHVPSHPKLKEYFYKTYAYVEDKVYDKMGSQYEDPDASILKAMNDFYIELDQIENPCIGIVALKDRLESITRYEYPSRFDTPFGEPLSDKERAKEFRPNKTVYNM